MRVMRLLLALACFTRMQATAVLNSPEARLYENLSTRFRLLPPPRPNASIPVSIRVSLSIDAIDELDIKRQILSFSGWLSLSWTDESLQWDAAEYDGVDFVLIPATLLWTPDIIINEGLDHSMFQKDRIDIMLEPNGTVTSEPGGQMAVICPLNLRYFPFDVQCCKISVTTWNSQPDRVYLIPHNLSINLKAHNDEWDIVGHTETSYYDRYSWTIFKLALKRKPLFYILNALLPIATLSILNLMVFRLPPASEEAVTYSVSIMVAFSVWLLMLSSSMPSTSEHLPLINIYVTVSILVSAVSVVIVILTVRMCSYDDSQPVPQWITCLCVFSRHQNKTKKEIKWIDIASAIFNYAFYITFSLWMLFTGVAAIFFATGATEK